MMCHESKISFLSMYDNLKLKNDATYEGKNCNFICNICCSHFLLARMNDHANNSLFVRLLVHIT